MTIGSDTPRTGRRLEAEAVGFADLFLPKLITVLREGYGLFPTPELFRVPAT